MAVNGGGRDILVSQPKGAQVGPIRFDGIFELNPPGSSQILLFVRYWVAPEYYHVAVVWAEPNSDGVEFPVYPPGLYLGSDADSFEIKHSVRQGIGGVYPKPIEDRGAFDCMFGDYPIRNLRFCEAETRAARITAADTSSLSDQLKAERGTATIVLSRKELQASTAVASLDVKAKDGAVSSFQLFSEDRRLVKAIEYEYEHNSGAPLLRRQRVALPERQLLAKLRSGNVTVTIRNQKYEFNAFPITHEVGGRSCLIEYQPTCVAGCVWQLPARIEVLDGQSQKPVRSVSLTNFSAVTTAPSAIRDAAMGFASFKPAEYLCHRLLAKYRESPVDQVTSVDLEAAQGLRLNLNQGADEGLTVGEQLKRLNMLMNINLLLRDRSEIECNYRDYLATLQQNGFSEMVLWGGWNVIDQLASKGDHAEATKLLRLWLRAADESVGLPSALRFAVCEVSRGNYWTCFQLLDRLDVRFSASREFEFQRDAMKCIALHALLSKEAEGMDSKSRSVKGQLAWALSMTTKERLLEMLIGCSGPARSYLDQRKELTNSLKALREKLGPIFQMVDRQSSNATRQVGPPGDRM
jgi:hypothetical protein